MNVVADGRAQTLPVVASEPNGELPDAPLAMPRQRLEPANPPGRGWLGRRWLGRKGHGGRWLAGLIRPLFARTGRSEV